MGGLFVHQNTSNANQQPAALGLSISTSVYGLTVPVVYGATRVPGNMLWYGAFTATPQYTTTSGGKGGGGSQTTQTGYSYSASFSLSLSEGPITSVNAVWSNGVLDTTDTFTLYNGSPTQSKWGYLTTLDSSKSLAYRNIAYIATANYNLGNSLLLPQLTFEVYGHGYGSSVTGIADVDPAYIITDILTNSRYGAGFPAASISNLTQYKNYCIANGLLFSPNYDTAEAAQKVVSDLLSLTNSEAYFSEGVLKITPYGDVAVTANGVTYTPNLTPVYDLGDDCFLSSGDKPITVTRASQADTYNQIDIECLDRSNSYNKTPVRASEQVNSDVYGLRAMSSVTAHQICDTATARNVAQLILQRNLYIRNQYTFTLPLQYLLLEPTDYVTINDSVLGLSAFPVRILTIEENDDELLITAEDAPAGVGSHSVYGTQAGGGGGTNTLVLPGNTAIPNIFVPPSVLTATGLEIWMGACGATPATWGGCEVWVSYDNVSYAYVGSIDSPARMGTLTATLAASADPDTTNTLAVNVLSGQAMGGATVSEWNNYATLTLVDSELTAYQTATLTSANHYNLTTLHRGIYGSTIASHASGANFVRVDQAMFKMPFTPDKIGQTIYVKLPAYNQFGTQLQQLSACTATSFTISISQVPTLAGIVVTPVYGGLTVKYTVPTQKDFGGVNVYMSTTSGFTPGGGNLVYSGPDSLITITADASGTALVAGTTYYIRLAGYTTTSKANMSYSAEYNGAPIMAAKNATASLYQWSSSMPSNPTGSSTFTWSNYASSAYTGGAGWSVTAPANPGTPGVTLWIASKVVSDNATATTTSVSWSSGFTVLAFGQNGANGTNGVQSATAIVYQWAATIPAAPSGTSSYVWSTGLFGTAPSGWSLTPGTSPSVGYTLWGASVSLIDATAATTSTVTWTTSSITARGYAGSNGTNGSTGNQGASSRMMYSRIAGNPTPTTGTVTTSGNSSFPTGANWGITTTWYASDPTPSSTDTLYQADGIYDPSTGNTVWSTPYISSLKVGSLSTITQNTGSLNNTGTFTSGSSPARSGTTMTGAGMQLISDGTFCLGNATGNITFNGTTTTLNGNVVATNNINDNAVTNTNQVITTGNISVYNAQTVTIQTVTLTTQGGYVLLNGVYSVSFGPTYVGAFTVNFYRDGSSLNSLNQFLWIDNPSSGTHTYTMVCYQDCCDVANISQRKLTAIELKR